MSAAEKDFNEQESLKLITDMIKKVKASSYETGISPLLWGLVVFVASIVTFVQLQFKVDLPFNVWTISMVAIIPQVIISIREGRQRKFRKYDDYALDMVWTTFALSLFGLIIYGNIVPWASDRIIREEGWVLVKHSLDNRTPDEPLKPFLPSYTSVFILLYAFPTLVTGVVKKFKPMLTGAIIAYGLFIASCFTAMKYDMLFSAITALVCWFIPGWILRKRYLKQKEGNV